MAFDTGQVDIFDRMTRLLRTKPSRLSMTGLVKAGGAPNSASEGEADCQLIKSFSSV
jgi:hypothetical protein